MTAPRQVLPGTTYLVTRRCSERRFFLRPSAQTNAIFGYVLAAAATRYGILVHAFCVLSNHFHLVVTDPGARLPEFHRYLDGLVARAVNCALGRWESFWDPDSYSAVPLDGHSVLEKMVYVLVNPVAARLVRRGRDWPGLWSDPTLIRGCLLTFARPEGFFRESGPMPPTARLELRPPPGLEEAPAFVDALVAAVREAEDRIAFDVARDGGSFSGAHRVLTQKASARPIVPAPRGELNPRVAGRNQWKRIEALLRLVEFRDAYRDALAAWKAGARHVLFPAGTWHMRVHHAARCAASA